MTSILIKSRDIERQTITVDRVPPNPNAILHYPQCEIP